MTLYSEYLDAKAELFKKELAFKTRIEEWFQEHERLSQLQPIDIVDNLTMDHFTITTQMEFKNYLQEFQETFSVKCIRIHHQEILTAPLNKNPTHLGEYQIKHVWKFHFKNRW